MSRHCCKLFWSGFDRERFAQFRQILIQCPLRLLFGMRYEDLISVKAMSFDVVIQIFNSGYLDYFDWMSLLSGFDLKVM